MARAIALSALVLGLALTAAQVEPAAAEIRTPAPERNDSGESGLESIADEAAEVGAEGTEASGMQRTVDEMNESEDEDGCIGADDAGCPIGPGVGD